MRNNVFVYISYTFIKYIKGLDLETIILIVIGFIIWIFVSKGINNNYQRSSGLKSIFWFILMIGTFSFLFGSNSSSTTGGDNGDLCDLIYDQNCNGIDDMLEGEGFYSDD